MSDLLTYAKTSGLFNSIDYHFAKVVAHDNQQHQLIALLTSHAYGMKHTMIPREFFYNSDEWFINIKSAQAKEHITQLKFHANINNQADWDNTLNELAQMENSPISVTDAGIYLTKNLDFEKNIVRFLKAPQDNQTDQISPDTLKLLNTLFPKEDTLNKQKLAAVNALLSPISIISGGPGTGKTTTVIKILMLLLSEHPDLHISLTAPTGKAAARLSESIEQQKSKFKETSPEFTELLDKIPSNSQTLHRLLSFTPNQIKPRYHHYHPLPTDLIIIDEASMIDLYIFNLLIQALPNNIRVIILGDKDQLASVEAGAIMGEVCQNIGYDAEHLAKLEKIMGESLAHDFPAENVPLNNVTLLTKSHRFSEDSGIGQLAKTVNTQKDSAFLQTIQKFPDELHYVIPKKNDWLQSIDLLLKDYIQLCKDNATSEELFTALHQFRILCATNISEFGTVAINEYISHKLFQAQEKQLYHGQAIMILQNDYVNQIFNGDVGLIVQEKGRLIAYFESDNGALRSIPVQLLPQYETAFAMTIHKSQGSEFDKVVIVLPDFSSRILTKELLYTGITRAKKKLTIIGTERHLIETIGRETKRFSGISQQLNSYVG